MKGIGVDRNQSELGRLTSADWRTMTAALLATQIILIAPSLNNYLVLPLMEEYGLTRGSALLILTVGSIGARVMAPVVGRLLTVFKPWIVMITGVGFTSSGLLLASFAPNIAVLTAALFLAETLGVALCGVIAFQTIVVRRNPGVLGRSMSTYTIGSAIIGVAIPFIVAPLLINFGWRATVATVGIVTLVPSIVIVLFLRAEQRVGAAPVTVQPATAPSESAASVPGAPTTWQILSTPAFWMLLLAIEPLSMTLAALVPNMVPFYADRGVPLSEAKYVLSILGVAAIVGALIGGAAVDRIGAPKYLLMLSSSACAALCVLSLDIAPPSIVFVALYLGLSGFLPLLSVAVARHFSGPAFAPTIGLMLSFMVLSMFAAPLAGWMRDEFGNYQLVFAVMAALMAVSFIAGLLLLKGDAWSRLEPDQAFPR